MYPRVYWVVLKLLDMSWNVLEFLELNWGAMGTLDVLSFREVSEVLQRILSCCRVYPERVSRFVLELLRMS